jgi:isochorismate synthase/2-succinyl-5-enolpyruvyl-6-hydroxy-3-cyclohexene-1-carboxylate synthase/2-succinyl-6-hydroxy-2,4-cyclohexadiene-1-carboxylate synthase/O-succinylbenzoate synthase
LAQVRSGVGAAVGANRGACGIDGVMSSAAGFAFGLGRAATLLIGDISFLHDVNGLNLLRTGEMRPPLTVVLVNNAGGGIFSFLPVADEVEPEIFSQLWATPQNVDLAGMAPPSPWQSPWHCDPHNPEPHGPDKE